METAQCYENHTQSLAIQGVNVLFADDCQNSRALIGLLLKSNGFTFKCARDGIECLSKFEQEISAGTRIDLIILDISMPRLDGFETAKALRQRGYSHPILGLTGSIAIGKQHDCFNNDFETFLSKHCLNYTLAPTIVELIDRVKSA